MINNTSTDEAHYTLLKQIYKHPKLVRNTTIFFGPRTEKRLFSTTATTHSGPPNNNMKYSTVQDVLASFPHPILPTVEGEPDYQTIHATRKFLQANSRTIDTHLGRGTLGHLGLIVSDAAYSNIAPPTAEEPTFWVTPNALGLAPAETDGTAAQLSAARHLWEEDVQTYRTCTSVQQALKKQIIGVFEPMYLEILNDNMVGYANISARDMLDHLFKTYGNITAVDLEVNFDHMRRAWDPNQPVESLFKQIQDCADYSEAGGVPLGPSQQINVGYAKIFATGQCMSACRRWNEKTAADKTWTHFKSHFAAAHRQHKQMKGDERRDGCSRRIPLSQRCHGPNRRSHGRSYHWRLGKLGNNNCSRQRCSGSSYPSQFSSGKTTRGYVHRVKGTAGFVPPGPARQTGPKNSRCKCEKLLLD
jgi:hypothetical protein